MEFLGPVLEIVRTIWGPVGKCFKYHTSVEKYMMVLRKKLEELNSKKEDIRSRLNIDVHKGKTMKKEVELWLHSVESINSEVDAISREVRAMKCLSRARLGKKITLRIQAVEKLHEKGAFTESLAIDAPPGNNDTLPTPELVGESTARRNKEEVCHFLIDDDNCRKIGVYGMGGIGKTTITKHIHNQIITDQTNMFERVIWVSVSKSTSITQLQDKVACALGVCLPENGSEMIRAAKLYAVMRTMKKYVLILDDVWEEFQLEDVGIPEPTADNESKFVLTTRFADVCLRMGCKPIKVKLLTEEEAWTLFVEKSGCDAISPQITAIAEEIAREGACLPLAIITIARSMKGVTESCEWRNALEELRDSTRGHHDMRKVLDLSDTSIEVLPNSISELEKLTVLLLRGCRRLRSVPPLTRLVALKWLDLCDTRVKEIPQGMEMLINLTYLNLYTPDLEFFPFGILPKLRNLQVLITYGASKTFMIKGQELAALTKLECVSGQLCDVHDMNIFTFSIQDRGPVAYCLRVGEYPCTRIEEEKESFGNLVILSRCIVREDELVLPNDIQVLELHDCQGFASICEIFSRNCATSLKSCRMSGCGDMECAFQSPLSSPSESLELLVLRNLENLLVFYEGPAATVPDSTFTNLKRLAIHECRKIKKLFTPNMQLHRLEDLEVSYCDQIEEIIEEHSINRDSVINFPMLRSLTLRRLPNLKTIFMGVIHCDSLQVCQVFGCPKLKRLPFSLLLLPKSLERICATREWWESLEWDQPNAQTAFQHFFGTDLRCSNF
ncbi:hypothetical protein V6N13_084104 [Hibiscus sabdariffa]